MSRFNSGFFCEYYRQTVFLVGKVKIPKFRYCVLAKIAVILQREK
jgi:hypothetical protein